MRIIYHFSVLVCFLMITNSSFSIDKKENTDFKSIDLVIKLQDVSIAGTLVIPKNLKTKSLVIMLSGSGPQDRDETLEGFKIFKIIAEDLAIKGIPSFRFDDRGMGKSTGDFVNSTITDHVKDLEGIIEYFKLSKKYFFNSFILLGHSQGGIIASKVATKNVFVKKIILMASPSVPLVEVVTYQVRQEYSQTKISKSLIEADVTAHNKLMRAIKDNINVDEAYHLFEKTTEYNLFKLSLDKELDSIKIKQKAIEKTNEYRIIYSLPSLSSFLFYDPSKDLEQLKVPVLGLFGGLDFQVPIIQNKDRMENALLKTGIPYQLKVFDKANHYFQRAKTGHRQEYGLLEKKFVMGFSKCISNWIIN